MKIPIGLKIGIVVEYAIIKAKNTEYNIALKQSANELTTCVTRPSFHKSTKP